MSTRFTIREYQLLVEALRARASRHDSMARFNPRAAGVHDRKSIEMRALACKLVKEATDEA